MTTPVILDCDPGHDDAIALLLALASPEIELVGVTTTHGNQTLEKTTDNALRVLALVGRTDVPVAVGAERPLVRTLHVAAHVHGDSGLDGPELPPRASEPVEQHAVDFLVEHVTPETVLVAVGPLTNVALALDRGIRPARIVLMGGAIAEGNMTPAAEFNIWADPEAAQRVFHSGLDVTMIGLDVTHAALLTPAWAERFREAGRVGTFVAELVEFFKRYHQRTYGWDGAPIHDAVALAHSFRPGIVTTERMNVEVELESELTRGRTVADRWHRTDRKPNADVGVGIDAEAFLGLLLERIAILGVIVAAAIAPHGMPAFEPGPTRDALEEIGRRVVAADPETVVVVTPHNVHVSGHFAVIDAAAVAGTLAEWGEADRALERSVDRDLAAALVARAEVPIVSVSYGGNDAATALAPMDWGTLIPLAFLPELPVVMVSPARDRALAEHEELGRAIADAAADTRVALVASADHGHAHDPDGPYGFDPAAAAYDALAVELVRENRLDELGRLAELVEAAKADSLWQLAVLHGALGERFDVELLAYEAPTYFGMLCAAYAPAA